MMTNNLSVRFVNRSMGASSWLWDFGDGVASALENPEHTYIIGGAYVVTLTATGAAGSSSVSKTVITVGVLNDVLLTTATGDEVSTAAGDFISVPAPP